MNSENILLWRRDSTKVRSRTKCVSFRHLRMTETYTGLWIMKIVAWPSLHGAVHCHVLRVTHNFPITSAIWTEEASRCCGETTPIFLLDFEYPFVLTKAWYLLWEFSRAHCYTTTGFANAESRQICNNYTRRLRNVSVCPIFVKEARYSEEILLPQMFHGPGHFRSIRTYQAIRVLKTHHPL